MCVDSHAHLEGASPASRAFASGKGRRPPFHPRLVVRKTASSLLRTIAAFRRCTTTKSLRALWKPDGEIGSSPSTHRAAVSPAALRPG